jgi:ABC-type multidrug transport system fused ATPase/permease subunit
MTILMQDARLFRRTVAENIAFGRKGASGEEIIAAAKMAEAHEFIMELPNGYNTVMAEGGDNLSGGQKQRINIARAIIRNKPIILLDEPVSGLDAKAEMRINKAMDRLTDGKTTLIIGHRFSTIANADKVLLLEEGHPPYFGTHHDLLNTRKSYRELHEAQFGRQGALESG